MAPDADDALLSITDAAAHMGVSTKTVRRYIAAGRLVAYRVGPTLIRLRREEVDALLTRVPTTTGTRPTPPAARSLGVVQSLRPLQPGDAVLFAGPVYPHRFSLEVGAARVSDPRPGRR